jgi:two-component system response regulator AtoC
MQKVYNLIHKVSKSEATVLITGESGTGKELVARAVHYESERMDRAFQVIDCTAFPEAILESELFGHIKGAFTGAIRDKRGLLEEADGGTVFFDEIGDLSTGMQMKLLRVLQEGEFKPVGGLKTKSVDLRVLAATNRNLEDMVSERLFREDLYYRLNVVSIKMPPLRARGEDVYLLAYYFLERFGQTKGHRVNKIDLDAMDLLIKYNWPGNVRELENVIERAVILSKGDTILKEDLVPSIQIFDKKHDEKNEDIFFLPYKIARRKVIESFTNDYLKKRLEHNKGNVTRAAQESGLLREAFHQIMRKYNIKSTDFKEE